MEPKTDEVDDSIPELDNLGMRSFINDYYYDISNTIFIILQLTKIIDTK